MTAAAPAAAPRDWTPQLKRLAYSLVGELYADSKWRMLYATDASLYQRLPLGVAFPKDEIDCRAIVAFAAEHGLPLTPRAGGTSLAGQLVSEALVVDCSRHMTQILEINVEQRFARVRPGVIVDDLNARLAPLGLMFAPNPSTSNRCTIGGVIGNNAWGAQCLVYGSTRDHVIEVEMVLADGTRARLGPLADAELVAKRAQAGIEGNVYRTVIEEVTRAREQILQAYPHPSVVCNSGYALHVLARMQPWVEHAAPFNLAQLVCGSEGTLGLITAATVKLVPIPAHQALVAAHFESLDEAIDAVTLVHDLSPSAVELIDRPILQLALRNPEQARHSQWLQGLPQAVLLVEFQDEVATSLPAKAKACVDKLQQGRVGYAFPVLHGAAARPAWAVRRAGLGLLMGTQQAKRPVTFIEDCAVPLVNLAEMVRQVRSLMHRIGTDCVYYGSVGMGLVHLRPFLDLTTVEDREKFELIAREMVGLLKRLGGTLASKHGDGRVRGPWLKSMLGDDIHAALTRIKAAFDPPGIFNPGTMLTEASAMQFWRADQSTRGMGIGQTGFRWAADESFGHALERCNGAGVCRRQSGAGTMCPSFRATLNEPDSTRGRANVLRQTIQAQGFAAGISDTTVHEVLDLCLGCKGCRSECPANVDMAKLKSEHLYHYHQRNGRPLRVRMIAEFERLARWGSRAPWLVNGLLSLPLVKRALALHPARTLPKLASQRFSVWYAQRAAQAETESKGRVIVLNDVFTEYYEPHIGKCVVEVLEHAGFSVALSPCWPSLRMLVSQGLLDEAREVASRSLAWLNGHDEQTRAFVGVEPSELLIYRDEVLDLPLNTSERAIARNVADKARLFDELMFEIIPEIGESYFDCPEHLRQVFVHGHCQQKAAVGMEPTMNVLNALKLDQLNFIPAGCCGMAGLFGYEREHYALSQNIGELVLFPAVRQTPQHAAIVASGTSCRHQIRAATGRNVYHLAELMRMAITESRFSTSL